MLGILKQFRWGRFTRAIAVVAVVLAAGGSAAWMASAKPKGPSAAARQDRDPEAQYAPKIGRVGTDGVTVPASVAEKLGLRTAPVAAAKPRRLPAFPGTLALDPNALVRVNSRFPGEVVELGAVAEPVPPALAGLAGFGAAVPARRPFRVGDRVNAGDLLAVVWCKDLGEKKSELADAVSRLRRDEEVLASLRDAERNGAVPSRTVRDAEQAVESSRIAVRRAEATLRVWRVGEKEIEAVREEATRVSLTPARLDVVNWARVEIRPARGGILLERNVSLGAVVDPSADLFKVADLNRLALWAHVFEEDLPLLQSAPRPLEWTVRVPSRPGVEFRGRLEQIGAVIDPAQHTALVGGTVDNPAGTLRAGMAVTVTAELPPPDGEVEVPAEALVEDGRQSAVFVQPDPNSWNFIRRAVTVIRRERDSVAVGAANLRPGERVLTAGSLLVADVFDDLAEH